MLNKLKQKCIDIWEKITDKICGRSVRRRIFMSNALMVLVTLLLFLLINIAVIKVYAESIETDLKTYAEQKVELNQDDLGEIVEDLTVHKDAFILLFGADGIICIVVLVLLSQLFTKRLTDHIMKPLDILEEGIRRIKDNDLMGEIVYEGDLEFENVCGGFNEMQRHLLEEQEKNHKYEKARTDMIAGISHDLRTPLTAVRGTIKGLMDGIVSTPEQQEKFLQAAYRRTGDMDVLLNQLFYLSKMETGNMPLDFCKLEIGAFIGQYVKGKQDFLEYDKEKLTAVTNGITAEVSVDPEQLQRIFDNMLENSRKYSEADPLEMKIELHPTPQGICICFMDNGVGVPEDKLPYIFDEFYRGDESRNRKEGNGLGLYIVKYLIEAMGGTVRAENADGLRIYLGLPLAEKEV